MSDEPQDLELNDLDLSFDDIFFNKINKSETIIKPEMVNNGVYYNQEKIIDTDYIKLNHILMLGLGSVGSHSAFMLNKLGFSSFSWFDPDVVSLHNSASSMYDYEQIKGFDKNSRGMRYRINGVSMLEPSMSSSFKLDLLVPKIFNHDPNANIEVFKTGFGFKVKDAIDLFNSKCKDGRMSHIYDNQGRVTMDYQNNHKDILSRNMNNYTLPSVCILATDSIMSRFKSILELTKKMKDRKHFAIIDCAVGNSLQGEVFALDLFNNDMMLKWCNSMIKDKYDDYDLVLKDIRTEDIKPKLFDLDDNVVCGDKMSIISSSISSLIVTNYVRQLFKDSKEANLSYIKPHTNWSMTGKYAKPYLVTQDEINY